MEELAKQFLILTFTKSQALKRLRLIKDFLNFQFFQSNNKNNFDKAFNEYEKLFHTDKLDLEAGKNFWVLKKLGEKFFSIFQAVTVNEQLAQLEKSIKMAKTVILYIPFELPEDQAETLGNWFKTNLGPTSLFEPTLSWKLIAGCALSYNGQYKDYSLMLHIKEQRPNIVKTLQVLKQRVKI